MTRIARIQTIEGIFITCQTVDTITKWQRTGSMRDLPSSEPPKRVPEIHYCCINEAVTGNELTASALSDTPGKELGQLMSSIA